MAKITQPGEGRTSTEGRLADRATLRGAQSIAQQERQLGREIENLGKEYLKAADSSIKNSFYNDAISTATLELNKRYTDRLSQAVDKNGNPTFGNLDQDVQKIAEDIRTELAPKLMDPRVASKFDRVFTGMVTNKRLQAQGAARQQHMQYSQTALNKALQGSVDGARSDDSSNLNMYINQVDSAIEDAIEDGVLDRFEADRLKERYNDSIRVAANQRMIDQDPKGAATHIARGSEATGVSPKEQTKLERLANAAVRDEEKLIKKQTSDMQKMVTQQQERTLADLESGIEKGTVAEKDIETAANSNMDINSLIPSLHPEVAMSLAEENPSNITSKQQARLTNKLLKKQVEEEAKAAKAIELDAAKNSGQRLSTSFSEKDIQDRYDADIDLISSTDENGNKVPPTLLDKAKVAITYNAPLKKIKEDIKYGLRNGDEEALQAYKFIKTKQPAVLDKLSKQDTAIGSYASMLVDHTNIRPGQALEMAREATIKAEKSDVRLEREDEFKGITAFKPAEIEKTIKDTYNLDSFLGFGGKALQPGIKSRFKNLLREAYVMTGDEEAAKQMLTDMTAHTYGVSEFNEIPGVLDDTERFMFMPPEKAYPGVSTADLKKNLADNVSGLLPKGVTADKLGISSDELTRAAGDKVTYGLFYIDDKGREQVITGPNGVPLRWEPDYEDLIKKQTAKAAEEARAKRAKKIEARKIQEETGVGDFGF